MLPPVFEGFALRMVETAGATIRTRVGGSGPPLLLLHGFPETQAMWAGVAGMLADRFTVVCTDLRGYGGSSKPESGPDHAAYSKRAMAADQVEVMERLGFGAFAVAGHDRGARCAYRLAFDHPERVTRLAVLDIVPTYEAYARADMRFGLGYWHWFFLAQPAPVPEQLMAIDPDNSFPGGAVRSIAAPEAFEDYRKAWNDPDTIHAMCEDYRAGATVDFELDRAELGLDGGPARRIGCPTLVLWGARAPVGRWYDVLDVWSRWAGSVSGRSLDCGHFLPEEDPEGTAAELAAFFGPAG